MDDVAVAEVRHWADVFAEMEKRKETVLEAIGQAGAMTDELRRRIEDCVESRELEDIYLPYKPKRRTRATVAKEAGLEPLADIILAQNARQSIKKIAEKFITDEVKTADDAIKGAQDIIAETVSDNSGFRKKIRKIKI